MQNLYTVHTAYAKRVHEIDTWRHIQVAFLYTVAVPGLGYLALGGKPAEASPTEWIAAAVVVGSVTLFAVTFATWSHKRILVLIRALHTIEESPGFLPEFGEDKSWLYWKSDLQTVRIYRRATLLPAWLQLPLLGVGGFSFYKTDPSGLQCSLFVFVILVLFAIQTWICRSLIRPELTKLSQPLAIAQECRAPRAIRSGWIR